MSHFYLVCDHGESINNGSVRFQLFHWWCLCYCHGAMPQYGNNWQHIFWLLWIDTEKYTTLNSSMCWTFTANEFRPLMDFFSFICLTTTGTLETTLRMYPSTELYEPLRVNFYYWQIFSELKLGPIIIVLLFSAIFMNTVLLVVPKLTWVTHIDYI